MDTYNSKPELKSLFPVRERISFLYVERCVVNRDSGAITFTDKRGQVNFPSSSISVLMIGPGCDVTHRAVELIADSGTTMIWVGEQGVRYYCHGRPLTHSSSLLMRQAAFVSNERRRLEVARKMYSLRFKNEDVSKFTMQQLRGREGARIRGVYRKLSNSTGVEWDGREYDPDDFNNSNDINKALSSANICLYGLAHSVIVALGLSAGLGFVHVGHERSFVYDVADLYKAETSIPISFEVVARGSSNVENDVRHFMRDLFASGDILQRMVSDICFLLSEDGESDFENPDVSILKLWDNKEGEIDSGKLYLPDDYDEDNK